MFQMFKPKEFNVFLLTICVLYLLPSIDCQQSESSTLDAITDSVKQIFNFDQVFKTFKKFSDGVIPFPFFVPILPKNKVMDLFRGKKQQTKDQDTLEHITELGNLDVNGKLNKLEIPLPLQQQLIAKMNQNFPQFNEQMFLNMRAPPEMFPEMPIFMNPGLPIPPPTITSDNPSNDFNDENNNYSERFESGLQSEEYQYSDDRKTPTSQDILHNWQIIDEELKKIGHQLGKLGKYLNRNSKQE